MHTLVIYHFCVSCSVLLSGSPTPLSMMKMILKKSLNKGPIRTLVSLSITTMLIERVQSSLSFKATMLTVSNVINLLQNLILIRADTVKMRQVTKSESELPPVASQAVSIVNLDTFQ